MNRTLRLFTLVTLFGLAACETAAGPGDHPAGVVILNAGGAETARFVLSPRTVTGGLNLAVGQTVTYQVRILTENGDVVPVDGAEYSIGDAGAVIAFAVDVEIEGLDRLTIRGISATTTSLYFDVNHAGHPEFQASGIPVVIQ